MQLEAQAQTYKANLDYIKVKLQSFLLHYETVLFVFRL